MVPPTPNGSGSGGGGLLPLVAVGCTDGFVRLLSLEAWPPTARCFFIKTQTHSLYTVMPMLLA